MPDIADLLAHLHASPVLETVGVTARRDGSAVAIFSRNACIGTWTSCGNGYQFTDGTKAADVYEVVVATFRLALSQRTFVD